MSESATQPRTSAFGGIAVRVDSRCWQSAESDGLQLFWAGRPCCKTDQMPMDGPALLALVKEPDQVVSESLSGHFALIYLGADGHCRLMTDRFATYRLYYRAEGGQFRVSDRLEALIEPDEAAPKIDHQSVVSYLFHHMIPSPATIYQGFYSSAPAEWVSWDGVVIQRQRWWRPDFAQSNTASEAEQADELMALLRVSVTKYCRQPDVGCFLSGGLDSSGIAGLASSALKSPKAFSIGFPEAQYNEIEYARTAVNHFGLQGHEYFMSPQDVVDALPDVIASMDQPFGNSSVMPTYFCAMLAKSQGIQHLIAGDGGDELFAGNERYGQQLRMNRWRQVAGPLVGVLDLLLLRVAVPDRPAVIAKAKSLTRQLKMSVPENLEYFNFLNLIDRKTIFSDELIEAVDLYGPDRNCMELFEQPDNASTLDRMLFLDWKHTLADNDLVKVNSMCRLAGVSVSYPMLDDRLVDFSLKVPSSIKLTPGNLRHLYKLAMKDFLPEKIINKPKHGFGLPFGLWTKNDPKLQKLAYEAIDTLKDYKLLRPEFIDDVKRRHQHEHAKHYGELVWVLMVLALWLEHHRR